MATKTLNRFKSDPRVLKILGKKPGDEGFSLIELVVVIAVLAILSAVALPNFLGVQKDGQVAAAKNTLATIIKECVTSGLRGTGTTFYDVQAAKGKLNGYTMSFFNGTDSCYSATASGDTGLASYSIAYTSNTGETSRTCTTIAGTDYAAGCFTTSALTTPLPDNVRGGSW